MPHLDKDQGKAWPQRHPVVPIVALVFLSLLVLPGGSVRGQQPAQQQPETQPAISVEVKVVTVLATVRDKKGQVVSNLGKDDFTLDEDGRPQTIAYFSRETDLPLTLGLLVDTSGSQRRVLGEERSASYSFLDRMLREDKDQAFLIHFDREVELLQDVTSSHKKLESALSLLDRPEFDQSNGAGNGGNGSGGPNGGYGGGGRRRMGGGAGTLLYDAVFLASDEVMQKQKGRKALIILSDGVDHGSKESLESAIESAQRADTVIYSILFADDEQRPFGMRPSFGGGGMGGGGMGGGHHGGGPGRFPDEERPDGKKILERISKETGGRLFEVSKKQPIDDIYSQIESELRSQYSLGYTSNNASGAAYRKIHLAAKQKDYVVQARDGYYADR